MHTIRVFPLLLGLLGFAAQAFPATVAQSQMSKGPSDDSCTPPAAVKSFTTTDPEIWAYFLVQQAKAGDVAKIEWLDPNGKAAATSTFDPLDSAGTYCFDSSLSNAQAPYTPVAGKWTVRISWNSVAAQTISFDVTAPWTVSSYMVTKSIPSGAPACTAPTPATSFLTTDKEAYLWFSMQGLKSGMVASNETYAPDGSFYDAGSWQWNPVSADGDWCFTGFSDGGFLQIAGTDAAAKPGKWTVKVLVDGSVAFTTTFNIGASSGGDTPQGTKCVSGQVDYVIFSHQNKVGGLADEVSIGGTKLCATCQLKPPVYGDFAAKLEIARTEGLSVDACYDALGTMNFLRLKQ